MPNKKSGQVLTPGNKSKGTALTAGPKGTTDKEVRSLISPPKGGRTFLGGGKKHTD